jgi:hypothetical protein
MAGRKYILSCEKGESVFTEPFLTFSGRAQELPGLLKRIEGTGDDRSFVLLTAVVVERYLDNLIGQLAPGFVQLSDNREFTFSAKISILKSFRLLPPHILQAADLIRRVRNLFAHDFETEQLEACSYRNAIHQFAIETFGPRKTDRSAREDFKEVSLIALAGLEAYKTNFRHLRKLLDDGELVDQLKKNCVKEFTETLDRIKEGTPESVEVKNGYIYTGYAEGLVDIKPIAEEKDA